MAVVAELQATQFTKIQYAPHATGFTIEGTPYAALARVQSCDMQSENNIIIDRGLGEGFNAVNFYYGPYNCSGSIEWNPCDFDFLKHWVGAKTGQGIVGDKYVLTEATSIAYTGATTTLQPFSIERANSTATATADVMIGCIGTTFSISGRVNERLTARASWVGYKDVLKASATSYTPSTDTSFIMIGGTWKWGVAAGGTALAGVRSFTIDYDNGLIAGDATRTIESRFAQQPQLGARSYKFKVEIIMAATLATSIYADFYGAAATAGPIDTGASPTASLEFTANLVNGSKNAIIGIDECVINRLSKPTRLGGGIVLLTFEGYAKIGKGNVPFTWWTV